MHSFWVKDLLINASQLVIMNETDPLILHTDATTLSIGGVLMQEQNGVRKTVIFIAHILSDQATRWRIMELVVRFRLLRQATHSLFYGEKFYSEDGP